MKTDLELRQDLLAELSWDPAVDASHIVVEVNKGVVILAGQVGSCAEKRSAELAARRVGGVKALTVQMKVVQRGESARKDSDIALNCESALRWTGDQPSKGVKVAVARGWITLTGMVRWPYQRKAAVMAVRDIPGVTGITDEITLAPANTSGQAQTDIVAALVHRARAKTRRVDAPQKGSEASRTTKVQSWSERNLARQSAWTSRGGSTTREDISKLH